MFPPIYLKVEINHWPHQFLAKPLTLFLPLDHGELLGFCFCLALPHKSPPLPPPVLGAFPVLELSGWQVVWGDWRRKCGHVESYNRAGFVQAPWCVSTDLGTEWGQLRGGSFLPSPGCRFLMSSLLVWAPGDWTEGRDFGLTPPSWTKWCMLFLFKQGAVVKCPDFAHTKARQRLQ